MNATAQKLQNTYNAYVAGAGIGKRDAKLKDELVDLLGQLPTDQVQQVLDPLDLKILNDELGDRIPNAVKQGLTEGYGGPKETVEQKNKNLQLVMGSVENVPTTQKRQKKEVDEQEVLQTAKNMLDQIGDRGEVAKILEQIAPQDGGDFYALRDKMLENIPQDGGDSYALDAALPEDAETVNAIFDKLVEAYSGAGPADSQEVFEIAKGMLDQIGDSAEVTKILAEIAPQDGGDYNTLRQTLLNNLPQDGGDSNILNAVLPNDADSVNAIFDRLVAAYGEPQNQGELPKPKIGANGFGFSVIEGAKDYPWGGLGTGNVSSGRAIMKANRQSFTLAIRPDAASDALDGALQLKLDTSQTGQAIQPGQEYIFPLSGYVGEQPRAYFSVVHPGGKEDKESYFDDGTYGSFSFNQLSRKPDGSIDQVDLVFKLHNDDGSVYLNTRYAFDSDQAIDNRFA